MIDVFYINDPIDFLKISSLVYIKNYAIEHFIIISKLKTLALIRIEHTRMY